MPRKLRVQYAGAIYHLMNRGDRREDMFQDDERRHRFLKALGQACEKTCWQVHAFDLTTVCDYVHLNPVRACLLRPEAPLESDVWSSNGLTLKWIAHRLRMGTWTHVSNCLVQKRKSDECK